MRQVEVAGLLQSFDLCSGFLPSWCLTDCLLVGKSPGPDGENALTGLREVALVQGCHRLRQKPADVIQSIAFRLGTPAPGNVIQAVKGLLNCCECDSRMLLPRQADRPVINPPEAPLAHGGKTLRDDLGLVLGPPSPTRVPQTGRVGGCIIKVNTLGVQVRQIQPLAALHGRDQGSPAIWAVVAERQKPSVQQQVNALFADTTSRLAATAQLTKGAVRTGQQAAVLGQTHHVDQRAGPPEPGHDSLSVSPVPRMPRAVLFVHAGFGPEQVLDRSVDGLGESGSKSLTSGVGPLPRVALSPAIWGVHHAGLCERLRARRLGGNLSGCLCGCGTVRLKGAQCCRRRITAGIRVRGLARRPTSTQRCAPIGKGRLG
ncbi:hypothetical protein ADZ36_06130 [Streptomyces fradiae]|uniref:Uncharacterized protein n=2 Tax=Streptomyces TaxID=1883 RepID=A0A3M8EWP3_9ACTN|nr:hypothetical protein ADZ36_06130 [Streptomyces fradiae]OFA37602.1 hypothetical protein BEN35_29010 [Streptomyces fradiae]PQM20521.1 hypothetical protein Sfr7A_25275 [Streptomyces xinghaiensis]RKM92462.1 hypothetical protein SFRA_023930 [Streptomyces xinghaiensis]RNC70429.1 hypothetical protein DC095_024920 [Streptomyces xinghaiensis]